MTAIKLPPDYELVDLKKNTARESLTQNVLLGQISYLRQCFILDSLCPIGAYYICKSGGVMTAEQAAALKRVCDVIISSVRESGPFGAPGGHIYAALMAVGCTIHQYEQIMAGLVRAKMLRKSGDCYHVGTAA
jgi:hypothetical protein